MAAHRDQVNGLHFRKEFVLIVDSVWFTPIMGLVGLVIIYLYIKYY